jgi:hypothetical protein
VEPLNDPFEELREGQALIARRLEEMNGTLRDVVVELGGAPIQLGRDPGRLSIRRRLHELEDGKHAAEIAGTALEAAKQLRQLAAEKRFSRREKIIGAVLAAVVASGPYLAPLLSHT